MLYTSFKNKELKSESLNKNKRSELYCKVSKASKEIMLDRFYNGNKIEFPFAP